MNRRPPARRASAAAFTLVELLVVIVILALFTAIAMVAFSSVRRSAIERRLSADVTQGTATALAAAARVEQITVAAAPPARSPARVTHFSAKVGLTPRLSVGTAEPESIYEATFNARIRATPPAPSPATTRPAAEYEIPLPLPPRIISLADLSATVDGRPSGAVLMRDGTLVWHGPLDPAADADSSLDVTYTAVGKGLYELQTPPGDVLETFQIDLTANGSDVRMMELSLQPTRLSREPGRTTYTWDYKRLMFGRPIALDVLGIAPIDRLGELTWLGPLSVVVFGLLVGLVAKRYRVEHLDRWGLLLVIGTFTAAYPLMYFAQEFVPLPVAAVGACVLCLAVIGWRAVGVMRPLLALFGVIVPAALIMAVTLAAAVKPQWQGLLLTAEAFAFFILAMLLLPRPQARADDAPPRNLMAAAA